MDGRRNAKLLKGNSGQAGEDYGMSVDRHSVPHAVDVALVCPQPCGMGAMPESTLSLHPSVMKRIRLHFHGSDCLLIDCLKLQLLNASFLQRINLSFDPMNTLTNASFPITFKHTPL